MRRILVCLALPVALVTPLYAQQAPRPIVIDRPVSDSLAGDGVHHFVVDLRANQFVAGSVDQHSMDVVVTVKAPDGATVRRIDVTARGSEPLQFESEAAGSNEAGDVSGIEVANGRSRGIRFWRTDADDPRRTP